MQISGIPFKGPIGAARVAHIDGAPVVLPTATQMESSKLDLSMAGTREGVLMVESEAKELPEDAMLAAVVAGHKELQNAINAIEQMAAAINNPRWDWQPPTLDEAKKEALCRPCAAAF